MKLVEVPIRNWWSPILILVNKKRESLILKWEVWKGIDDTENFSILLKIFVIRYEQISLFHHQFYFSLIQGHPTPILVCRIIIHPKASLARLFPNRRLPNYSLSQPPLIFLNSPGNFMQNLPLSRHWGVMDLSRGLSRLPRKSRVICSLSRALRKHRWMPGNSDRIYCQKEEHWMSLPDAANF